MDSSLGFCPLSGNGKMMRRISSSTSKSTSSSTSLNLKASDILARARKAAGQPAEEEEEEPPQIFADEILDDMQQALLTLEDRIKGGPGCLSVQDVNLLEQRLDRIIFEMNDFMINGNEFAQPINPKPADAVATATTTTTATATTTTSAPVTTTVQASAAAPASPGYDTTAAPVSPGYAAAAAPVSPGYAAAAPVSPVATSATAAGVPTVTSLGPAQGDPTYQHNPEEGSPYEGKGGLGLASGTANTWIIDGMDEMTGEEYRAALQESVSRRQAERRKTRPNLGNLQSNNYLDSLSR